MISVDGLLLKLALLLDSTSVKVRTVVLELLSWIASVTCRIDTIKTGHGAVLHAMNEYKLIRREPRRFYNLVQSIQKHWDKTRYVRAVFMFINSLIFEHLGGLGASNISEKKMLQQEFINLRILSIIDEIEQDKFVSEELNSQLEPLKRTLDSFTPIQFDGDPEKLARALKTALGGKSAYNNLVNIMQYLMMAVNDNDEDLLAHNWDVLERLMSKAVINGGKIQEMSSTELELMDQIQEQQKRIHEMEAQQEKQQNLLIRLISGYSSDCTVMDTSEIGELCLQSKHCESSHAVVKKYQPSEKSTFSQCEEIEELRAVHEIVDNPPYAPQSSLPPPPPPLPPPPPFPESLTISAPQSRSSVASHGAPPLPPPPPMSGVVSDLPDLPQRKPSVPMRQFHWSDIKRHQVKKTIFITNSLIEKCGDVDIEEKELERLFTTKTKESKRKLDRVKPQVQEVFQLLDGRRSHNFAIILRNVRIPHEDLANAILNMDETLLTSSRIEALLKIMPTQEEINLVSAFDGDVSRLAEPEQFILAVKDIPLLEQRLTAWNFRNKFSRLVASVKPDLDNLMRAAEQVQKSSSFHKLLSIILAIGNYLNSSRRAAWGFKITSLNKLVDVRSSAKRTNLLQYLVQLVKTKYPHVLALFNELEDVPSAARIDMQSVQLDIGELKRGLHQVERCIGMIRRHDGDKNMAAHDRFEEVMSPFISNAAHQVEAIDRLMKEIAENLETVANMFGEDVDQLQQKPELFFQQLALFMRTFSQTELRLEEQIQQQQKRKRLREKRQQQQQQQSLVNTDSPTRMSSSTNLLEMQNEMITGSFFSNSTTQRSSNPK